MTTEIYGTGAGSNRADLALVGSRYLEDYGLGPKSQYIAARATSRLQVDQSGSISIPDVSMKGSSDASNKSGRRPLGGSFPHTDPVSQLTANVVLDNWGYTFKVDWQDEKVRRMYRQKGQAGVEEWATLMALNFLLQKLDYQLLTTLTNGTSPFTATDVNAASVDWNDSPTAIAANFRDMLVNLGTQFDSLIWDFTSKTLFKSASELTDRFHGNQGAGIMDDGLLAAALGSFGITQNYMCEAASPLGDKVVAYRRGTGDAERETAGIIFAYEKQDGSDEYGFNYYTEFHEGSGGQVECYTVWIKCDPDVVVAQHGVRAINVY